MDQYYVENEAGFLLIRQEEQKDGDLLFLLDFSGSMYEYFTQLRRVAEAALNHGATVIIFSSDAMIFPRDVENEPLADGTHESINWNMVKQTKAYNNGTEYTPAFQLLSDHITPNSCVYFFTDGENVEAKPLLLVPILAKIKSQLTGGSIHVMFAAQSSQSIMPSNLASMTHPQHRAPEVFLQANVDHFLGSILGSTIKTTVQGTTVRTGQYIAAPSTTNEGYQPLASIIHIADALAVSACVADYYRAFALSQRLSHHLIRSLIQLLQRFNRPPMNQRFMVQEAMDALRSLGVIIGADTFQKNESVLLLFQAANLVVTGARTLPPDKLPVVEKLCELLKTASANTSNQRHQKKAIKAASKVVTNASHVVDILAVLLNTVAPKIIGKALHGVQITTSPTLYQEMVEFKATANPTCINAQGVITNPSSMNVLFGNEMTRSDFKVPSPGTTIMLVTSIDGLLGPDLQDTLVQLARLTVYWLMGGVTMSDQALFCLYNGLMSETRASVVSSVLMILGTHWKRMFTGQALPFDPSRWWTYGANVRDMPCGPKVMLLAPSWIDGYTWPSVADRTTWAVLAILHEVASRERKGKTEDSTGEYLVETRKAVFATFTPVMDMTVEEVLTTLANLSSPMTELFPHIRLVSGHFPPSAMMTVLSEIGMLLNRHGPPPNDDTMPTLAATVPSCRQLEILLGAVHASSTGGDSLELFGPHPNIDAMEARGVTYAAGILAAMAFLGGGTLGQQELADLFTKSQLTGNADTSTFTIGHPTVSPAFCQTMLKQYVSDHLSTLSLASFCIVGPRIGVDVRQRLLTDVLDPWTNSHDQQQLFAFVERLEDPSVVVNRLVTAFLWSDEFPEGVLDGPCVASVVLQVMAETKGNEYMAVQLARVVRTLGTATNKDHLHVLMGRMTWETLMDFLLLLPIMTFPLTMVSESVQDAMNKHLAILAVSPPFTSLLARTLFLPHVQKHWTLDIIMRLRLPKDQMVPTEDQQMLARSVYANHLEGTHIDFPLVLLAYQYQPVPPKADAVARSWMREILSRNLVVTVVGNASHKALQDAIAATTHVTVPNRTVPNRTKPTTEEEKMAAEEAKRDAEEAKRYAEDVAVEKVYLDAENGRRNGAISILKQGSSSQRPPLPSKAQILEFVRRVGSNHAYVADQIKQMKSPTITDIIRIRRGCLTHRRQTNDSDPTHTQFENRTIAMQLLSTMTFKADDGKWLFIVPTHYLITPYETD